ncbi:MAG: gluconeogenesis factor YvcK family protein [Candidatus Nealsonbacteria bacterium]
MMEKNSKIVCLGGGNGMPKAVLAGLKNYPVKISVISATLDNGGSAGRLRKGFKTGIAFGDIRRAALALSEADVQTKQDFAYRDWDGNVMANVFCTAMVVATGSQEVAIQSLKDKLKVPCQHEILPVTLDDANICAVLENGQTIVGETNIDMPKHDSRLKIKNVYLAPKAKAYSKAIRAIKNADVITIGPGDLYSTLAHILLVDGIAQAIKTSKAQKVYICNLMQKRGETDRFIVQDFVTQIEKFLGDSLNFVIYNTAMPDAQKISAYKKEHPELLGMVENRTSDSRFIGTDLLASSDSIAHDPDKLAKTILSICKPR